MGILFLWGILFWAILAAIAIIFTIIILFHKFHTTDIHFDKKTNDYGDWLLM